MGQGGPTVIVLAGPNGAGKTTAARTLLAEMLKVMTFVNADVIAQGLSGFDPASMAMEAGRILLQRLRTLAEQQSDFAFETTLAGRTYTRWLTSWRQAGYTIHLVYFWLASADLAVARVAQRVRMGGHAIPETTIRQRYQRSIHNFFNLYRSIVTSWEIYDNSPAQPLLIAHGESTGRVTVLNESVWSEVRKGERHE